MFQLGQECRIVLHYTDTEYKDEVTGEGWGDQKFKLGLDFPNLPYFIDGELKLTQSDAILRHIGRKNDLFGKSPNEMAEIDMVIDTAKDFKLAIAKIAYNPDFVSNIINIFFSV